MKNIHHNLTAVIIIMIILFSSCTTDNKVYYVSPSGNDQNSGDQNQPFATIERAKEAAAEILRKPDLKKVSIFLEPGNYSISKPVTFSSKEFNNHQIKLLVKNSSQGEVVISGGNILKEWRKMENGLWVTDLSQSFAQEAQVRELFIDGKRAKRARYPNEDYLRVKKVGDDKRTHFFFENGDFPMPQKVEDTELILLHDWSISRIPVLEIDQTQQKLTAVDTIGTKGLDFFTLDNWEAHPRYYLENDLAFLDQDYEWYFDREHHKIFVKMPSEEVMDDHLCIIPISNNLIHLEGTPENPLHNISFEGITFRHSAWYIPLNGYAGVQAAHYDPRPKHDMGWSVVSAAISGEFIDSCIFRNCIFENLGGTGLWLGAGATNNQVLGCQFKDISANGIMIGEGRDRKVGDGVWWETAPEQVAKNNLIEDCQISDCGVQYFGAVGIWCGLTEATKIRNNELSHLPYTGISIGWMWNPTPTPAKDNIVSGNHIHHIMQKLSDGGGIYMLGLQPGSKLIGNLIHDVKVHVGRAESNGMFLDEGITDVLVAENTIYDIAKSPIRFHKATTNIVRDNTLFCREGVPPFAYNRTDSSLIQKIDNKIYHPTNANYLKALNEIKKLQAE